MLDIYLDRLTKYLWDNWDTDDKEERVKRNVIGSFLETISSYIYNNQLDELLALELFGWEILCALSFIPIELRKREYVEVVEYLLYARMGLEFDFSDFIPDEEGNVTKTHFSNYEIEDCVHIFARALYQAGIITGKYTSHYSVEDLFRID